LSKKSTEEIVLKGIPAASGIAMGHAFLMDQQDFIVQERAVLDEEVPIEIARFEEAVSLTKAEIQDVKHKIEQHGGGKDAQIFDAHLLVLDDSMLIDEVKKYIRTSKVSAEYAFSEVLKRYIDIFEKIESPHAEKVRQKLVEWQSSGESGEST